MSAVLSQPLATSSSTATTAATNLWGTEITRTAAVTKEYVQAVEVAANDLSPRQILWRRLFQQAAEFCFSRRRGHVTYLSDNGGPVADVARGEIQGKLHSALQNLSLLTGQTAPTFIYNDTPSQDTLGAAFSLAQLARLDQSGLGQVYFVNCAPRKQQRGNSQDNKGEKVYAGILPNGAIVAGTGADAFTLFKDLVQDGKLILHEVKFDGQGTQFRSRDIFPMVSALLAFTASKWSLQRRWASNMSAQERDAILCSCSIIDRTEKLDAISIPDLPDNGAIAIYQDVHGNVKTGLRHAEITARIPAGEKVIVVAGDKTREAVVKGASFSVSTGDTAISCGSSGEWVAATGQRESGFAEVFTVGGRAADQLGLDANAFRNGTALHFIPVKLIDSLIGQLPAEQKGTHDEIALLLVQQGFVSGLDFSKLGELGGNAVSDAVQKIAIALPHRTEPVATTAAPVLAAA